MAPGACSPVVESVALVAQASGSGLPTAHAFARIVVGADPITWIRRLTGTPAETLAPVNTSGAIVVSIPAASDRVKAMPSAPVG